MAIMTRKGIEMKKIVAVCLLLGLMGCAGIAFAACGGDYDYAELKDMSQKELLKTYCENFDSTHTVMMASLYNKKYERETQSCMAVTDKIERVYMKKFKVENRDVLIKMCNFPK